jgi:hypothetical protein
VAGSTWWNSNAATQRAYPQIAHAPPASATSCSFMRRRRALYGIAETARTAVAAASFENVRGNAMVLAGPMDSLRSLARRYVELATPSSSQGVLREPVPDGRIATAEPCGYLAHGQPFGDQPFQLAASNRPLWREPVLVRGSQAVLRQPVADRRRMPADARADFREAQPIPHVGLEYFAVHAPKVRRAPDRRSERVFARYSLSRRRPDWLEALSFARTADSIWRTRSRVTPTSWPMASRVLGSSAARP